MSGAAARPRLADRLARIEDGSIIRAAFYLMLAGTLGVLYVDYRELNAGAASAVAPAFDPAPPGFLPFAPEVPSGPAITTDIGVLKQPMVVALEAGGVLSVRGTFDPGSAERFAAEVAARGEYVHTVAFDSPGGSVSDAMAMGELIRERGFATSVAAGALCASSCPLAFAGGTERLAAAGAAIGVHQIYAGAQPGDVPVGLNAGAEGMSSAQRTTAEITRYLSRMGVDTALWLHALDTPPQQLYYFSEAELEAYRLATPKAAEPKG